ncbi:hypothetical protein [Rhodococcoides fascians]|uniref:hypothetical protein n=1 Tax=Rhodococcoides fascians TaxID=1828 RepID=UPI00056B7429|nr:hypothetical protein [Rhodococcus fascians]
MSTPALDPTSVRAAAQAALANRLDYIDRIVDAQNTRADAATKLAAATETEKNAAAAEAAAIKAALDSGWTAGELRTAGLKVPTSLLRKTGAPAGGKTTSTRRPRVPRRASDTPEDAASTTDAADLAGPTDATNGDHDGVDVSVTREFAQAR